MNKSNLQVNVRNVLTIVLVPVVLGAISGFFIQPHVAWLTPAFSALIAFFIVTVGMLIYRISQNNTTAVGGWFMGLLATLGAIGYYLVNKYTRWDWWAGPAIGLGVGVILTLVWIFLRRYRSSRRVEPEQRNHVSSPRSPSDGVHATSLSESIQVALDLPSGTDNRFQIAALNKALQGKAEADILTARAKILEEMREYLKAGFITFDEVSEEVRRFLGIKPKVKPATQEPRKPPVTQARGLEHFGPH